MANSALKPSPAMVCSGRSMVSSKPVFASTWANASATTPSGSVISSRPFFCALVKKMSAKLGATTQRKPYSSSAHTACSRLEPQPKLRRASRMLASA